ncbi:hypothetical protein BKA59DRAFT_512449 [Fusarium tricinctum]|uniref:Uncharacterized protein n=1 Tax=Fusarium tricinctum TaxID=61284 RepID=A0A8K0RYR1_9HYPO|nr:hypothetical protein BKA59DRAFT_512449 [Fusarium tricinctum]
MKTKPTYKESSSGSDSPYFADNDKPVRKAQRNKARRESRQARRRREIEREWNHKATSAYMARRATYWIERALKAEKELKEREFAENELAERELAESLHRAPCENSRSPSPSSQPSVNCELPLHTTFMRSNNVFPTLSTSSSPPKSGSSEVPGCDVTAVPFSEFFPELAPFWTRVIARTNTGSVMVEDGYDVFAHAPYDGNSFSAWLKSVVRAGFTNEEFWEDLKNPAGKMSGRNGRRPPNYLHVQRPDCPDLAQFWNKS